MIAGCFPSVIWTGPLQQITQRCRGQQLELLLPLASSFILDGMLFKKLELLQRHSSNTVPISSELHRPLHNSSRIYSSIVQLCLALLFHSPPLPCRAIHFVLISQLLGPLGRDHPIFFRVIYFVLLFFNSPACSAVIEPFLDAVSQLLAPPSTID